MKSLEEATAPIQLINIVQHLIHEDGTFPNNSRLPLLIYKSALQATDRKTVEELFESNRWINSWEGGIFDYHHYHSTAHEVLAVTSGNARIQFGGPGGIAISLDQGDVAIIPAGVAHKCLESAADFKVVGAYPEGQLYNILYGKDGERPVADENIKSLPLPESDPILGFDGPLMKNWRLS
ncbi:cupin domain-containing protein [Chryseosolibacter indicus]|uniref:Cupin n=1 Tax=Chryseosolibacter indicus TaxID=2782351 RepID=A0ABS5VWU1_9BACT|nr:cupin domain-containing protein [Chryseosolibacter indicus]MBT1705701.1 cupin [Chryseosolibacter indicus]